MCCWCGVAGVLRVGENRKHYRAVSSKSSVPDQGECVRFLASFVRCARPKIVFACFFVVLIIINNIPVYVVC